MVQSLDLINNWRDYLEGSILNEQFLARMNLWLPGFVLLEMNWACKVKLIDNLEVKSILGLLLEK